MRWPWQEKATLESMPGNGGMTESGAPFSDRFLSWATAPAFSSGGGSATGINVTMESAHKVSTVYACQRLISDSIAGLPFGQFARYGPNDRRPVSSSPWMKQPNADDDLFSFLHQVVVSLLSDGNFFGRMVIDRRGEVREIWPLYPAAVQVERGTDGFRHYRVGGDEIPLAEVFHIRGMSMPGQVRGMSPLEYAAKEAIALAAAGERFGGLFFSNGANAGGHIKVSGQLSQDQADALQARWAERHAGLEKAHRPAVLAGGAEWVRESVAPQEAQFLELRSFQVEEICRVYGVPPHMVGSVERSTSWGSGIEQQSIGFVTYTLRPWIVRLERAFGAILSRPDYVPPAVPMYCQFNVSALMRGDYKSRMEGYATAIQNAVMSPGEVRSLEEMPPYDGDSTYYYPMNMSRVGDPPPA